MPHRYHPDLPSAGHGQDRRHAVRLLGRGPVADARFQQPVDGSTATPAGRRPPVQDRSAGTLRRRCRRSAKAPSTTLAASTTTARTSGCRSPNTDRTAVRSSIASIPQTMKATEVFRFADHIGAHRARHGRSHAARRELGLAPLLSVDARRRRQGDQRRRAARNAADAQPVALRRLSGLQVRRRAPDALHRRHRDPAGGRTPRRSGLAASTSSISPTAGRCTRCRCCSGPPAGLDMTHNPVWLEAAATGCAPTSCPKTISRRFTSTSCGLGSLQSSQLVPLITSTGVSIVRTPSSGAAKSEG